MVMNIETNDMLTTSEAARLLGDGTHPGLIQKHCQRGVIKAVKVGKQWLISIKEITTFKETRKPPGRPAR
jgi:excisionase family DNA binding protein